MSSGKQNKPFPIKYCETYTHRSRMYHFHYHSFLLVSSNCPHTQHIIITHVSFYYINQSEFLVLTHNILRMIISEKTPAHIT